MVTYRVFISAELDKVNTFAIEQEMDLTKRKKMSRTLSFGLIYTFYALLMWFYRILQGNRSVYAILLNVRDCSTEYSRTEFLVLAHGVSCARLQ